MGFFLISQYPTKHSVSNKITISGPRRHVLKVDSSALRNQGEITEWKQTLELRNALLQYILLWDSSEIAR